MANKVKSRPYSLNFLIKTLLGVFATMSAFADEPGYSKISTFRKFVNGEVPIEEAVMFRQISGTNGYSNKEWWRFGYQNGFWFVQILKPAETNASVLLPKDSLVCGASDHQLWYVTDKNFAAAEFQYAKGSNPERVSALGRSLISEALSLGVPRELGGSNLPEAPIQWDGLKFKTTIDCRWDESGVPLATAPLQGELKLGENGLPASTAFPTVEELRGATIAYEYSPDLAEIPKAFTVKNSKETLRYEFISLTLGPNVLASAKGYEPSMFADMNLKRFVDFYTNELQYEQRDGGSYPGFRPPAPKIGAPPPELQGTNWLNSQPLTLAGLRGKVVLLDFWAVQCVPCILALPHTQELYDKYKKEDLVVIGVCADWGSEMQARRVLKERNITFPNLMDRNLAIASLQAAATARSYVPEAGIPCYALIDRAGNLSWKSVGEEKPTAAQIETLLKQPWK